MSANQIMVVDDEVGIRELLFEILRDEGYGVRLAENAQTARNLRREMRPDLVLLDIWMPDTDGITLLKEWAGSGLLTMPVVMMSGHGTIDSAVEATRIGAFDFLEKPISLPKLLATVGKALAGGRALPRAGLTMPQLGKARIVQELRQRLDQVSRLRTPVLLVGEPGCGFDIAARQLHLPNTPWVAPEDTEWLSTNPFGPLNEARDGTLFIQELCVLGKAEQKGLAQLAAKLEKFNVRLVCAASGPLAGMVERRQLRRDPLPPALGAHDPRAVDRGAPRGRAGPRHKPADHAGRRQRGSPQGAHGRRAECAAQPRLARQPAGAAERGQDARADGARARRSAARTSRALRGSSRCCPATSRPWKSACRSTCRCGMAREQFERQYFLHHIRREEGNMSRVAERVGLERTHLYRKLKQLGIRPSSRGDEPVA